MKSSLFLRSVPAWGLPLLFVMLILGLMACLPWLPALASGGDYYGIRVDRSAATLANGDNRPAVPPASGLAVVFFGYRNCGTVCPVQLANLLALRERLSDEAVGFVFVTLDPERDSQEALDGAMAAMGPGFVAVRPDSVQAARSLARRYNDHVVREDGDNGAYDFHHTTHLHVVSSQGRRELLYTTPDLDLDRVAGDLRRLLSAQGPQAEAVN